MTEQTNAELIAEARAQANRPMLGLSTWRELDKAVLMIRRLADALEVAEQDTREPSDAEVLAALNARELSVRERNGAARHFTPAPDLTYYSDGNIADMRAALLAAQEVRRAPKA